MQSHSSLERATASVLSDSREYVAQRRTGLDQNQVTPAEFSSIQQHAEAVREVVNNVQTRVEDMARTTLMKHKDRLVAEVKQFEAQYDKNAQEIRFFAQLQEQLAAVKSKVSAHITAAMAVDTQIDEALDQLHQLISRQVPNVHRKLDSVEAFVKMFVTGHESTTTAMGDSTTAEGTDHEIVVDTVCWTGDDAALSSLFRKSRALFEGRGLVTSKTMHLLGTLDGLRKLLCSRGLFLGCLAYGCDFVPLPPESFIDRREESAGPTEGQPLPVASKKPAAVASKGRSAVGSTAKPTGPLVDSGDHHEDASWNRFLRTAKSEIQVTRLIAPFRKELMKVVQLYFATHPGPLIRTAVLGSDQVSVLEALNHRISLQEQRHMVYLTDAIKHYRLQIQRAHTMLHGVSEETYSSFFDYATDVLEHRMQDTIRVFSVFYQAMAATRRAHGSYLKAPLATPGNRPKLVTLTQDEEHRHSSAVSLIRKYTGIVSREIQDEAQRLALRSCHILYTLFSMLRSFVSPEHLTAGEKFVIGQHRGLKRLMRLKQREDLVRQLQQAAGGGASPLDKSMDKTRQTSAAAGRDANKEPLRKARTDDKSKSPLGPTGKQLAADPASDEAAEDQHASLMLPDKLLFDFPGITLNGVRCFDEWQRKHSDITLKAHQAPPLAPRADIDATGAVSTARVVADSGADGGVSKRQGGGRATQPAAGATSSSPTRAATKPPQGPNAPSSTAHDGGDAEFIHTSAMLQAPRDRAHQAAFLARQRIVEQYNVLAHHVHSAMQDKLDALMATETTWAASWQEAVSLLRRAEGTS